MPNEEQLIAAINHKDPSGWKFCYDRYYGALCTFVTGILKQEENVEDLVQEIYIAIWEGNRTFTNLRELTNYLYRACYNNALLYIRNHQLHDTILDTIRQSSSEVSDEEEIFHALATKEELIRQLHATIQALPAEQRRMMLLRIEGYSWEEIAEQMGVSINTIKTQRSRSFKFLRSKLSHEDYYGLLLPLFYSGCNCILHLFA